MDALSTPSTKQELLAIINGGQLTSVFQPIVNLQSQSVYGFEALIRGPANSKLHNPLTLFDCAGRYGLLSELEYACSQRSCDGFSSFEREVLLFLNISPLSLLEQHYRLGMLTEVLDHAGLSPENVVIELSEQYPMEDYMALRRATDQCRAEGFSIAIDDLGAGYAGLRTWSELRPDFVKIDRHFVERIHEDPVKREFVRSIQEIASELGCQVVAEGIETIDDLNTVRDMGIPFGQGYYIGRPEAVPEQDVVVLARIYSPERSRRQQHRSVSRARELARNVRTVAADTCINEVYDLFQQNRNLHSLPVIRDAVPVGIVERKAVLELMSESYSRSHRGSKSISVLMDTSLMVVDVDAPLEDISRRLTADPSGRLGQQFLITEEGRYIGLGNTSALLRRITEQQVRNARYANPLTLLPGNVPLHEHMEDLLTNRKDFRIAYFDINCLKAYNDHYGYQAGDDVISTLGRILLDETHADRDFVAHTGGDNFIAILRSEDWEQRCHRVLDIFHKSRSSFYKRHDYDAGGIWNMDRAGEPKFFGLLTLAAGVARPDPRYCSSLHEVSALAANALEQARKKQGGGLFCSRRRRPTRHATGEAIASA